MGAVLKIYTPRGTTLEFELAATAPRNLAITFGTISIARSTSASELNRPNEKRRLPLALSSFRFIARRTCDASPEPVRHADPAEQQILCRSNIMSPASDSMPPKARLDVFGKRARTFPLIETPETFSQIAFSNRSRIARTRVFSSSIAEDAHSAAF